MLGVAFLVELAVAVLPARAAPIDPATTAVALHDDDRGTALFDSAGLHPGRIDTACVSVAATGSPGASSEVRLSAEVSEDDLAPYLMVTVERGTVGSFRNCASFTGDFLWTGALADFPAPADPGIPTGWHPADLTRAVYRFTVTVLDDPRAQRREASATFVWTLVDSGSPAAPIPPPAQAAPPTSTPTLPTGSPPTAPVPPYAAEEPELPPTPTQPAQGTSAPDGPDGDGDGDGDGDDVVLAPALRVPPSTIEQVTETALELVRDAHFPLALLAVLTAFLVLQGALDRRDPKLALARTHQELREFRQFPDATTTRIDPT